ncbi:MAG: Carbohydrate binding family 6 [Myxococcales bacterium]|jgi:hypothetical protein|nr:Carbohydrate binding family 6 [Myxococcales bacterium]
MNNVCRILLVRLALGVAVITLTGATAVAAEPAPPPGTPPPVSPGNGQVAGVPASGGGSLYYCKDALLTGFQWFDKFKEFFPNVLHSGAVNMAYADTGKMTFKNVASATAGTRTLTFSYAFAEGLFPGVTDRPMGIEVNGAVITSNMHFAVTGSFSTYKNASIQVPLKAGTNVVSMFAISEMGVSRVKTMIVK